MGDNYSFRRFPKSRIATFDTFAAGLTRHHINALLEFDVTESRKKLQALRRQGINISFNGWMIRVIAGMLQQHPETAAFLYNKRKLIIFDNINISILVEKKSGDKKVPIPVIIERADTKSAREITAEIDKAKAMELSVDEIVINKRTGFSERIYYHLPGIARRMVWKILLGNPKLLFPKMGNAVVTSVGMAGRINGWFIHKSVHPVSFGIGSVLKKPVAAGNKIAIREILNMTILVDHDVIDGAPMVRFLNDFTRAVEAGDYIDSPADAPVI